MVLERLRMGQHLLVTGFGPFPGMMRNPSGDLARRIAASPRWRSLGIEARAVILTTSYAALEEELKPLLEAGDFDALLMIGVSGRAMRVHIEQRATNRANLLLADADGRRPSRLTLGRGPSHRPTPIQPATIQGLLRRRALPCAVSQNAGRYLCNAAYYAALGGGRPVLFLHIPNAPRATRRVSETGPRRRANLADAIGRAFVDIGIELLRDARQRRPHLRAAGAKVAASASHR
ncbi:MAG: Pyrrolidone-carboxylate peptidase [uncultured Microvirga sp.]|uniref:Pyrrolidone-carboxylate peptidase n=1 Tax=uncultured Microvirga sp. TaxID=412392 RepID=A0A6J4MHB1_9HYPH|nr:MAG: Pyrrolidone-carboxylate peptidase [uncultured Microvirga sp.]